MAHEQRLPVLTLKHDPAENPPEHRLDPPAHSHPLYLLKRHHSTAECAVYAKHPRRQTYLGTSADPAHSAERTSHSARQKADKVRGHIEPSSSRQDASKS